MGKMSNLYLNNCDNLSFDESELLNIASAIPNQDFIDGQFDTAPIAPLTDIILIYSTPRSGSTFLSDLIHKSHICLPHEYFQPSQYLPLTASRWRCLDNGVLNEEKYIRKLIENRTSEKGILGLNIHGEHLSVFSRLEKYFPNVALHHIHVMRIDSFSQAISYEMAAQTGKWSSFFEASCKPTYSYEGILRKMDLVHQQNSLIRAYLNKKSLSWKTVQYEDLVADPKRVLIKVLPPHLHHSLTFESSLKRQSSASNEAWKKRFSDEYIEKGWIVKRGQQSGSFLSKVGRLFRDKTHF